MQTPDSNQAAVVRLAGLARDTLHPLAAAAPFLENWPTLAVSRPAVPVAVPVLRWLPDAAALAPATTAPLMAALAASADDLTWRQSYAAADFGACFLERYGWTEFVGTRGPIGSEQVACGVLVLGPDTTYPLHAHLAEELYLPLAGTAFWQRGTGTPEPVAPGTPIHHPPWMPHSTRTGDAPLVALYVWRGGGLGAKPRILEGSR